MSKTVIVIGNTRIEHSNRRQALKMVRFYLANNPGNTPATDYPACKTRRYRRLFSVPANYSVCLADQGQLLRLSLKAKQLNSAKTEASKTLAAGDLDLYHGNKLVAQKIAGKWNNK